MSPAMAQHGLMANHRRKMPGEGESRKLKTRKPQRLMVERKGAGTLRSGTKCSDDGIGERALSFLESDHSGENLLLVFHNEHVGLKDAFDSCGDFMGR